MVKALNVSSAHDQIAAKFLPLYEGPYRIKKCVGIATYLLEERDTKKDRVKFHSSLLERYQQRDEKKTEEGSDEE